MADDSVGRRMPFAFLTELQRRVSSLRCIVHKLCAYQNLMLALDDLLFINCDNPLFADMTIKFTSAHSPDSATSLPPYGLNAFSPQIAQLMHTFNTSPPTDVLTQTQNELNQVRDIMVQNVEQILSRGERIELLMDKTDTLSGQAWAFRRGLVFCVWNTLDMRTM